MGNSSVNSARWFHRFLPGMGDFLFLALLAWLFLPGRGWRLLLEDGDTGWHIRTGEWILREGRVPRVDLFSFSRPEAPWFAWEWLSDVLLALLHGAGGLGAVAVLGGVLIAASAVLTLRYALWKGASPLVALPLTLLMTGAASTHFLARPHLFTLLFLPITLWLLDADRQSPGRRVWLLVPLTWLWCGLHGGFLVAPALVLLQTVALTLSSALQSELRSDAMRILRYASLAAACLAITLLNPYGWELHAHIAGYLQSSWIQESVEEFQSPKFRAENIRHYEILLLLGLIAAGARLRKGFSALTEALFVAFWAHQSLSSVRHVPLFAFVAAPLASLWLTEQWNLLCRHAGKTDIRGILQAVAADTQRGLQRQTAWSVVFLLLLVFASQLPSDFPSSRFPVAMVDRHGRAIAAQRVFTSDQWADYLIYRSWPSQRVFLDGRSDFYGPDLGLSYRRIANTETGWERDYEKFRFESALLPVSAPLVPRLQEKGWQTEAVLGDAIYLKAPSLAASIDFSGFPLMKARHLAEKQEEYREFRLLSPKLSTTKADESDEVTSRSNRDE
jgi:hypothetical protein